MSCQQCGSNRLANIEGQSCDGNYGNIEGKKFVGSYVPKGVGVGSGDYIRFTWCLDCGQIQGKWPVYPDLDDDDGDK